MNNWNKPQMVEDRMPWDHLALKEDEDPPATENGRRAPGRDHPTWLSRFLPQERSDVGGGGSAAGADGGGL